MDENEQEQLDQNSLQTESRVKSMDTGMLIERPDDVKKALADDKAAKRALADSIFNNSQPSGNAQPQERTGMLKFLGKVDNQNNQ